MNEKLPSANEQQVNYVRIDEDKCNGCVLCMKVCPTKAIRVRDNHKAVIVGVCIDCGECVKVCPRGAVEPIINLTSDFEEAPYKVVSPSTAIYAQFGPDVMPNDVLLALKKMGFDYVHDQSYTSEMFNVAIELYVKENHEHGHSPWPLISPVCPVVVRLIRYRYPSLLKHLPPLATPREIVAREAKKRLSKKHGCSQDVIKVIHVTPCAAKMICIREPFFLERSYLDAAVGISSIHEEIVRNLKDLEEDTVLHHSGGIGLGWGMSGGEIAGLHMNCLAVSGLSETIKYLEQIEMGLLTDIEYVEFRMCTEGCIGGPLTVVDKYRAKHRLQTLVRLFGAERRVKYEYVKNLYDKGWFLAERAVKGFPSERSAGDIKAEIRRRSQIEKILQHLPRKECGLCGSPDCETFAEDVVNGRSSLDKCVFLDAKRKAKELQ